ncbi:MAG: SagB/ThcOx family dehydrogenase [Planctomycetota bacterium]|jgi:SagB-type dehydrogenase family enzyme
MVKRTLMMIAPCLGAVLLTMAGVTGGSDEDGETIALAKPNTIDGMAVAEAIRLRRSLRDFDDTPLTPAQMSQLCWAAQGITDPRRGRRAAPSAGALYPMTVFVVDARGVFEYLPHDHALRRIVVGDERKKLQAAALDQECVGGAPMCLVIAMNVDRTATKYGSRALRYCLMEAGHVAQNVMLQATDLGMGGVTVGAFDEQRVAAVLKLSADLRPVYLLPLGHPG